MELFICETCNKLVEQTETPSKDEILEMIPKMDKTAKCCYDPNYRYVGTFDTTRYNGNSIEPVRYCPTCKADIFEVGIFEIIENTEQETDISFGYGKDAVEGISVFGGNGPYLLCGGCRNTLNISCADLKEQYARLYTALNR